MISFVVLCGAYFVTIVGVLYALRSEPLYEPRVLFTLAASLWLLIIPGYLVEFEGYLAAKPGFYEADVELLSVFALGLMLLGYGALVGGATLAVKIRTRPHRQPFRTRTFLVAVCLAFVALALANFLANVYLVSGGNLVVHGELRVAAIRGRRRPGRLCGGISPRVHCRAAPGIHGRPGQADGPRPVWTAVAGPADHGDAHVAGPALPGTGIPRCVLCGLCDGRITDGTKADIAWPRRIPYLLALAGMGVGLYFLRLASALKHLGVSVDLGTATVFFNQIVHFALERGNVPNFPVVFTIIEKIPSEQGFLLGKTLFNWALFPIPKSILKGDYLISLWIKDTWYAGIEGGGLPPTAIGEWYANFGIGGVVGGMFLVGFLLGRIFKRARLSDNPFLAVLWANLAFGFIVIYPKTDLAQIPAFSIVIVFATWLLVDLLRAGAGRSHA